METKILKCRWCGEFQNAVEGRIIKERGEGVLLRDMAGRMHYFTRVETEEGCDEQNQQEDRREAREAERRLRMLNQKYKTKVADLQTQPPKETNNESHENVGTH